MFNAAELSLVRLRFLFFDFFDFGFVVVCARGVDSSLKSSLKSCFEYNDVDLLMFDAKLVVAIGSIDQKNEILATV